MWLVQGAVFLQRAQDPSRWAGAAPRRLCAASRRPGPLAVCDPHGRTCPPCHLVLCHPSCVRAAVTMFLILCPSRAPPHAPRLCESHRGVCSRPWGALGGAGRKAGLACVPGGPAAGHRLRALQSLAHQEGAPQHGLLGRASVAGVPPGTSLRRVLRLLYCSAVAVLKFLILCKEGPCLSDGAGLS